MVGVAASDCQSAPGLARYPGARYPRRPSCVAGVVVVIGWVFVQASYRSLGAVGILLGGAFFGTFVWSLIWLGGLQLGASSAITWAAMLCLAGLLSIGISWSHVRRRITGQVDVDEVDTR